MFRRVSFPSLWTDSRVKAPKVAPEAAPQQPDSSKLPDDDAASCWICLDTGSQPNNALRRDCRCPHLFAHQLCLARWQLHKAGTREERYCRFCDEALPDWRSQASINTEDAPPVMTIVHNGITATIHPEAGPNGLKHFKEQVTSILGLDASTDVQLVFECVEPFTGSRVTLKGAGTYEAAIHCAAVSAARRRLSLS